MSAITYDKIKITSAWNIQTIYELSIKKTLNNHAELCLTALVNENDASKLGLQETTEDQIRVYTDDGETKNWLFKGRLKNVKVSVRTGLYTITAYFLSETSVFDSEQKNRSFQDISLTYNDIVSKIMEDYPEKSFELTANPVTIDGPLIQYQETDWQFIKRLASYQETVIVPDVTMDNQIFAYGYPKVYGEKTLPDDIAYSSGKDIKAYYTDYDYNPNLVENEYTYFEVESYDELIFGDKVTFHNYEMYVGDVKIELKKGLLVYNATLVRQPTIRQNPIYNEKIQGNSIEGTVLAVQNQEIKLHLNIDQEQDEATAYWYPFVPPTTDMLYLMPQIGTNASLYIPGLMEQNAIITGCVRTNGAECEQTSDPSTRYLATEYGQEMKLAPGGIYFTAGRNDLVLTFDDEEGVTISSHKGILLEAKEEIIIDSKTKVTFSSPNQIKMVTPTGGFSIENEIHFANMKTIIDCADETELPPVEQPLMQEEKQSYVLNKPQTTAEPGIDWGGLISAALGTRVAEASPLKEGETISSAPDDGPTIKADDGTGSPIVRYDTNLEDDGKGVTKIAQTADRRTVIEKSDGTTTYIDSKGKKVRTYNAAGYLTKDEDKSEDTETEYDGTSAKRVTYSSHNGPDYIAASGGIGILGFANIQGGIAINCINGDTFFSYTYSGGVSKVEKVVTTGGSVVAGKVFDTKGNKMSGNYLSDDFIPGITQAFGVSARGLTGNIADNSKGTAAEIGIATPGYSGNAGKSSTFKTWEELQEDIKNKANGN